MLDRSLSIGSQLCVAGRHPWRRGAQPVGLGQAQVVADRFEHRDHLVGHTGRFFPGALRFDLHAEQDLGHPGPRLEERIPHPPRFLDGLPEEPRAMFVPAGLEKGRSELREKDEPVPVTRCEELDGPQHHVRRGAHVPSR
jgi:hypothetical protein